MCVKFCTRLKNASCKSVISNSSYGHNKSNPIMILLVVFFLLAEYSIAAALPNNQRVNHRVQLYRKEKSYRLRRLGSPDRAPLYAGYGTHFAYLYVGTPSQRQSVIIDTGSHFTAFPCKGCSGCGTHTDSYWDPDLSSSKEIPQCAGQRCELSQSYAEGSSWHAYKVTDKIWIGGEEFGMVSSGALYNVTYTFGCQTSESGLFKTQLEDGIMGMSISSDSFQSQMQRAKLVSSTTFNLCFRPGGGVMSLGGVDEALHASPSDLQYASLKPNTPSGWYGVTVLNVQFRSRGADARFVDIAPAATIAGYFSKLTIVDSGTTDTYLPASMASAFEAKFKSITGLNYKTDTPIALTEAQLAAVPDIVFTLLAPGAGSSGIEVIMPYYNYVERSGNKYEFSVFVDESSTFVLGANFMAW
jgi:hypothetical protein